MPGEGKGETEVKSKNNYQVIILGAGLAGLTCADELLRNAEGQKPAVLVLEKLDHYGGLAATLKKNGFLFDLAPHRWFTKNDELNTWLDQLMAKELKWVKKYTPMFQFGKFFNYPIEVFDVLKKVNLFKIFWMLTTFVWARFRGKFFKVEIKTMKDAYINRFGFALYQWFCREFNSKLWGVDFAEKMSADFVEQRTKDLSMVTIIKEALGLEKKVISLTPKFRFPQKGIGRISDNLVLRIKKNQGEIKTKVVITQIIKNKNGYQVVTNQGTFQADQLVSSIPLDELLRLLSPKIPSRVNQLIDKLNFVHQKIVVLLANKSKLTDFTWVYVHPPKIKTFRFLETNNWSKAMSPKGKTSLVFEYPYQPGEEIESMGDDQLIEITINDLITHFSPTTKRSEIAKAMVFSVPKAYPKYDLGYQQPLEKIKQYLAENHLLIQIIGRGGRFRYNNMDHSILTGLLAARNILAGKQIYDLDNVNNEAEYLEEKKVK